MRKSAAALCPHLSSLNEALSMAMGELRHDPTTGNRVIIAPERERRPHEGAPASKGAAAASRFDPACPFCPGNEAMLPPIIAETASTAPRGWKIRVVANKFPAVSPNAAPCGHGTFYQAAAGLGYQEVLIESPRHDQELTSLSDDEVRDVLAACRCRYAALKGHAAARSVIVFRNRGAKAGVSLPHPHSQVIALESVPPLVRAREAAMFSYFQKNKRCVLCDIIAYERNDGSRLAGENSAFVTLVPFGASVPCEMWLLPKRHQPDFGDIEEVEIGLLASALRDALIRLAAALSDPPYCYMIDTAVKGGSGAQYLHWRLRIVPRSTVSAGFELPSGLPINPHLPEQDAAVLRHQPD